MQAAQRLAEKNVRAAQRRCGDWMKAAQRLAKDWKAAQRLASTLALTFAMGAQELGAACGSCISAGMAHNA